MIYCGSTTLTNSNENKTYIPLPISKRYTKFVRKLFQIPYSILVYSRCAVFHLQLRCRTRSHDPDTMLRFTDLLYPKLLDYRYCRRKYYRNQIYSVL
jgi:hypothetical protein